jgi:hypothetical protein
MGFAKLTRQLPARVAAGAFILNSGLGKWGMPQDRAAALHKMAVTAYPFLDNLPSQDFGRALSASEIALGTALLLPVVPAWLAGSALSAFAGGLLGMYWKTEGMHEPGSVKPTAQGTAIAKDVWMLGIGLSLVLDDLTDRG